MEVKKMGLFKSKLIQVKKYIGLLYYRKKEKQAIGDSVSIYFIDMGLEVA